MAKKNESCKTLRLPITGDVSISIRDTTLGLASSMALVAIAFSSSSAFAQMDYSPNQATPEERAAAMKALMEGAPEEPAQTTSEPELNYDDALNALSKTQQHSTSVESWGETRHVLVPKGVDPSAFIQDQMIKPPEVEGKFLDGPRTLNAANISPIAADTNAARALPASSMGDINGIPWGVQPPGGAAVTPAPQQDESVATMKAPPAVQAAAQQAIQAQAASQPTQASPVQQIAQPAPTQISYPGFSAAQPAFQPVAQPVAQPGYPAAQPGYVPQGYVPQGYAPQGYAPQGYAPQGYAPGFNQPVNVAPRNTMVTRDWSVKDWVVPTKNPAAAPAKPAAQGGTPASPAKLSGPATKNPSALALVLVTPAVMAGENAPVTPEDSVALYNKAVKLHLAGQLDEAIEAYGAAIAANPELGPAFCNRGLIFNQKRLYTKAIEEFHKALAIDPKDAITYNGIGAALRAQKDMPGAIKNWQTAITLDPKLATAHYNLGTAYEIQKDYEKAIDAYDDAINHDSKLGEAYYRKGLLLIKLDKVEDAKEFLSKSLKASPASATAEYSASARSKLAQLEAADAR